MLVRDDILKARQALTSLLKNVRKRRYECPIVRNFTFINNSYFSYFSEKRLFLMLYFYGSGLIRRDRSNHFRIDHIYWVL